MNIEHDDIWRGGRARSTPVLTAATLNVPADSVVGLVGINGAGKSSLMLAIANLLSLRNRAFSTTPVAYAPQRPAFPEWLAAKHIAGMFGLDYDDLDAAYPALLLDELRTTSGARLSVGQAQALSIAIALHARAPLTLLDEPFAPLDFRRRIALSNILRARPRTVGGTVIVSSQSAAELLDVCDWLIVLREGRYAFTGAITGVIGAAEGEAARLLLEEHVMSLL